jgi:hypothetical protein
VRAIAPAVEVRRLENLDENITATCAQDTEEGVKVMADHGWERRREGKRQANIETRHARQTAHRALPEPTFSEVEVHVLALSMSTPVEHLFCGRLLHSSEASTA